MCTGHLCIITKTVTMGVFGLFVRLHHIPMELGMDGWQVEHLG